MGAQVPDAVARPRLHALQALLLEQQADFNAAQGGRTLDVLFEKKGRQRNQAIGRSPYLQSVHMEDADHLIGQIVPVFIASGEQNSLTGQLPGHHHQSGSRPQAESRRAASDRTP